MVASMQIIFHFLLFTSSSVVLLSTACLYFGGRNGTSGAIFRILEKL